MDTQEILEVELTVNDADDASTGILMLQGKTSNISRFSGDGVYDKFEFREVPGERIVEVIPPLKNAVIQNPAKKKTLPDYLRRRNQTVERINKHGSTSWKREQGYHKRSLNEVVMFRYKTIFSGELDARLIESQKTEARLKCFILNKFTGNRYAGFSQGRLIHQF